MLSSFLEIVDTLPYKGTRILLVLSDFYTLHATSMGNRFNEYFLAKMK